MRFSSFILSLLLALATSTAVKAQEAVSEVAGFVEVDVAPGHFAPLSPVFSPVAKALGKVTAVTDEGTVTLSVAGDAADAATSWWRPLSGKAIGKTIFGTLTGNQFKYSTQYGGTPGTGLASTSLLQVGDTLRMTPFWLVDEFLGAPADGLFTTAASLYDADQFRWGTMRGWASDDGSQKFWALAGTLPPDYIGDVAINHPLDSITFFRNSAAPNAVLTFKGAAATTDTLFNIVPGNVAQSAIFRPDGKPFTLADAANTANGLVTGNAATGLVGGTSPDKADALGIWSDSGQKWTWVYWNTTTKKWLTTTGVAVDAATMTVPGGMMFFVDRPATLIGGTVKLPGISNTASTTVAAIPGIDKDKSGLPDRWEATYDLVNHKMLHPKDDLDGDGYTNVQELLLGGDPNVFEHPAMPSISVSGPSGSHVVTITFKTAVGAHYRLETRRGNETTWQRVPDNDGLVEFDGDGSVKSVIDETYVFTSRMPHFYRVVGMLPLDSDKDGLSDYEEVNVYRTNPFSKDTDQDGVTDLAEILKGTDPRLYVPSLVVTAGNGQYQAPEGWLSQAITVTVRTNKGTILPYEPVTFVMTHGKGLFAATPNSAGVNIFKTRADASGKATAFLKLDAEYSPSVQGVCFAKVNDVVYTAPFIAFPTQALRVPTSGLLGWFSAGKGVVKDSAGLVNAWNNNGGSLTATGTGTTRPKLIMDNGRPWLSFNGYQKLDLGAVDFGGNFSVYFVAQPTASRTATTASTAYASRLAGVTGQRYLLGSNGVSGSTPYVIIPPKAPAPAYFSVWKQVYFPGNSATSHTYNMLALPAGIDPSLPAASAPTYRGDDTTGFRVNPAPSGQHASKSLSAHTADFNKANASYWVNYAPGDVTHLRSYTTFYVGTNQPFTVEDYYRVNPGTWKGTGGTRSFDATKISTVGFGVSVGSNSMGTFEFHSDYYPGTSDAVSTGASVFGAVEVADRKPSMRISGGTKVAGAASLSTTLASPRFIGGFGGTGSGFVGRVGEILIFDHTLSDSDRMLLEDTMAALYRVPMADRDADGMADWWEMAWFGGRNVVGAGKTNDNDGDSANNLTEYKQGTSPTEGDTDGDGISDSAEVKAKTNPLTSDTDGDLVADNSDAKATDATNGHALTAPPGKTFGVDYVIAHDALFTDRDGNGTSDLLEAVNSF